MRLVLLIGHPTPQLTYFVNQLQRHHTVDLLVIENKADKRKKPQAAFRVSYVERVLKSLLFRVQNSARKKQQELRNSSDAAIAKLLFGDDHLEINPEIPILNTTDINSDDVMKAVRGARPNLMIDHGTSLVKAHILEHAELSLNLHWGLSPYYRGVECTKRALINWDINNIGVTIHKLATKIDGGDILGQARVHVGPEDSIFTITCKLTKEGVEILKQTIDAMKTGLTLQFKSQDLTQGYLTHQIHNDEHAHAFISNLTEDVIRQIKKKPARDEAPIISFKASTNNSE